MPPVTHIGHFDRPGTLWVMAETLRARLDAHRAEILEAVARHRGRRVRLFGSVARGDDTVASDIDLLVDFEPGSSLFDLYRLTAELESLLGHRVDVVSSGGLKPRDGHLLADAVEL
jgi:predicted nucleotidyltransferase